MATTGLQGPYQLSSDTVEKIVSSTSPGAYALGVTKDGTFYIHYVGRSDDDVADRLGDHVGKYREFKFDYFATAKAAYEKECNLYHDFNPPDNKAHPAMPRGVTCRCPGGCP